MGCCVFCNHQIGSKASFPIGSFEYRARDMYMCDDCYEDLMNIPKPTNTAKFGKYLFDCNSCKTPIYESQVVDGQAKCKTCGTIVPQKSLWRS